MKTSSTSKKFAGGFALIALLCCLIIILIVFAAVMVWVSHQRQADEKKLSSSLPLKPPLRRGVRSCLRAYGPGLFVRKPQFPGANVS